MNEFPGRNRNTATRNERVFRSRAECTGCDRQVTTRSVHTVEPKEIYIRCDECKRILRSSSHEALCMAGDNA